MAWNANRQESIVIGDVHGPGIVIQQQGRSPSLTLVFPDDKTASECAKLMQSILDKASAIAGRT